MATSLVAIGQTYDNPVIRGDVPDPTIMRIGNNYYATGTSSEWAPHYPVFHSYDLVNWEQVGHIFSKKPEWTRNSFWAPEFFKHNDKVYCYYSARRDSDGVSCIGVATAPAESPTDFTDHGIVVDFGKESIDAYVYNDNGKLYISWKAYGLDHRPIEIVGQRLSDDGLKRIGQPFTMLVDDENIGMEGQCHFKHGDYYYIIYAARGCCGPGSDYEVRIARSKHFEGPYEKYAGNPILNGNDDNGYQSIGHGTIVDTPDGRMFYLCHSYVKGSEFFVGRQPALHELIMTADGWAEFAPQNNGQMSYRLPFTDMPQKTLTDFVDEFNGRSLDMAWTWDYMNGNVTTKIAKGKLKLSGDSKNNSNAICVRPRTSCYEFSTKVKPSDTAGQGLTLYGDNNNQLQLLVTGNDLQLVIIKDGNREINQDIDINGSVHLKISINNGREINAFYSDNGKQWKSMLPTPMDGGYMLRWDRVFRPGLIHVGKPSTSATFDFFKLHDTM